MNKIWLWQHNASRAQVLILQSLPPATLVTAEHMCPMPTSLDGPLLAPGGPAEQLGFKTDPSRLGPGGDMRSASSWHASMPCPQGAQPCLAAPNTPSLGRVLRASRLHADHRPGTAGCRSTQQTGRLSYPVSPTVLQAELVPLRLARVCTSHWTGGRTTDLQGCHPPGCEPGALPPRRRPAGRRCLQLC